MAHFGSSLRPEIIALKKYITLFNLSSVPKNEGARERKGKKHKKKQVLDKSGSLRCKLHCKQSPYRERFVCTTHILHIVMITVSSNFTMGCTFYKAHLGLESHCQSFLWSSKIFLFQKKKKETVFEKLRGTCIISILGVSVGFNNKHARPKIPKTNIVLGNSSLLYCSITVVQNINCTKIKAKLDCLTGKLCK